MSYPSFTSQSGQFRIDIVGYREPNNQRMLNAVEIFYNGKAITKRVLPENWPYTNGHTDRWMLEDEAGQFVYVPAEGQAKLIDSASLEVFTLPYQGLSAASFVGNSFAFGRLVEVFYDCVVVTELEGMISAEFPQPKNTYVKWAELIDPHTLKIKSNHYQDGKRVRTTIDTIPVP